MKWYLNSLNENSYSSVIDFNNVFTEQETELLKSYENVYEEKLGLTGKNQDDNSQDLEVRRSNVVWLAPDEKTEWVFRRVTDTINTINQYYRYNLTGFMDLQLTKYYGSLEKPHHYTVHADESNILSAENLIRKLSLTISLSSPDEYEGGDLKIYRDRIIPEVYRPEKGNGVSFPSYTLHEVTPVTQGVRYSLVVWVYGPRWS